MAEVAVALAEAARKLEAVSDTPRLDAELLMAHSLGIERGAMLLRMPNLAVLPEFAALLDRRIAHEPVAYIIGHQDFWNLTLLVTPAVLIPRADSEILIEAAQNIPPPRRILDLGTGSGALLLAALSIFPDAGGIGLDASGKALAVAKANADRSGFGNRCQFIEGSWHDVGWQNSLGQFDLVLCNPPYVESNADLAPQVRNYEPHSALFAGTDGLTEYRALIPQIPALFVPGGVAIFEIGKGQENAVSDLAAKAGLSCVQHKDYARIVRAIAMTK